MATITAVKSDCPASTVRYAIIKFDDRNRFGMGGVPATLLFAGGQRVIVYMKDATIEKAGKRNRFAKVVIAAEGAEKAELIELLGEVGSYAGELQAYQLHFGVKPCRYPKPAEWALLPLAEGSCVVSGICLLEDECDLMNKG